MQLPCELEASASANGVLAYSDLPARTTRITWSDRNGKTLQVIGPPDAYGQPRLSPDGRRLLVNRDSRGFSTWVYDFGRDTLTPLTSTVTSRAQWSPDGSWIAYARLADGPYSLFRRPVDGGSEERLTHSANEQRYPDFHPGGRWLMYTEFDPQTLEDLWLLPLYGDRKPVPFLRTSSSEQLSRFSPDGKWVAYVSDESGRPAVYIRAFAPPGVTVRPDSRWLISNSGGQFPEWRGDGKELYYWSGTHVVAVAILRTGGGVATGKPVELFPLAAPYYDVARDGRRFLLLKPMKSAATLTVITNWESLLGPHQ